MCLLVVVSLSVLVYVLLMLVLCFMFFVREPLSPLGAALLSQGGLTIVSTTHASEVRLKRRQTLEVGMGTSLILTELLQRSLLK